MAWRKLAVLDDVYISQMLLDTLKKEGVPVFAEEKFQEKHPGLRYIELGEAKEALKDKDLVVYTNAEGVLPIVTENSANKALIHGVRTFKDKHLSRKLMKEIFPDVYFTELPAEKLKDFKVPKGRKLIVKPTIGFFSKGIRVVDETSDMAQIAKEVIEEVDECKDYNRTTLNSERFLIEEFLEGEEYAIDAYFDKAGKPVIMGITHHIFRDKDDTRDLVYLTNKKVMREMLPKAEQFLSNISEKVSPSLLPIHMEVRLLEDGRICPIEINPLRFGGYSLADIAQHAFGFNEYATYLNQEKPDWDSILENMEDTNTAFVLGRKDGVKSGTPNHEKFRSKFAKVRDYIVTKPEHPVFAIVFGQEKNIKNLEGFLHEDCRQYFDNPTSA